jgi:hypothetical protein
MTLDLVPFLLFHITTTTLSGFNGYTLHQGTLTEREGSVQLTS